MRLLGVPVFLWFAALLGAQMLAPAAFAASERDWETARLFLYSGLFTLACAAILGVASRRPGRGDGSPRGEILTYAGIFAAAPLAAAIPFALVQPTLGLFGAYFEAVSSLTTTGATLLPDPDAAPRGLHLWRAMLGWTGGLATLTAAAAVLTPRGLLDLPEGGASGGWGGGWESAGAGAHLLALDPGGARVMRVLSRIAPLYAGLTLLLTVLLLGDGGGDGFTALCHAMGVLSTSGISPGEGRLGGVWAEAAAALFMIAAASRLPWRRRTRGTTLLDLLRGDPEWRLLALTVTMATAWLFGRHWIGALELSGAEEGARDILAAFWGTLWTVISFATTTGYVSADWAGAQNWSGLDTPTLLLLGLAALGGGVASTAGGIKLFRSFALFQHGMSELNRAAHPSALHRPRRPGGRLSPETVTGALVFTMLFMAAMSASLTALALAGMPFDAALTAAVAALANAGPAFPLVQDDAAAYARLPDGARAVLCAIMVLGRIEVLALVALFNPNWWRR